MSRHPVSLIVGHEANRVLVEAVRHLVAEVGVSIDWQPVEVPYLSDRGWQEADWDTLTRAVLANGLALCCPLVLPAGAETRSPHVELRERCGCFAGLRPVRSLRGLSARVEDLDVVIVRETTEDVYAGHEHEVMPGGVTTLKVVSENACDRIAHFAFSYARRHHRRKVSIIHKANIMKKTDGLFLRTARRVANAYPEVEVEDLIVDNASMQMVLRPQRYDVILCGNLYGDILSALAAGLAGAVAAVPGIAIGKRTVIYESLLTLPRRGLDPEAVDPLGIVLPAVHLLRFLGEDRAADRIFEACEAVLMAGQVLTPDLGGTATTAEMTQEIVTSLADHAPSGSAA